MSKHHDKPDDQDPTAGGRDLVAVSVSRSSCRARNCLVLRGARHPTANKKASMYSSFDTLGAPSTRLSGGTMFVELPIMVLPTATTSGPRSINRNNRRTASILLTILLTLASFGVNAQAVQPPLSWNDPLFNGITNSGAVTLSNGGTISNKSITADGGQASVQCNGACAITNVRISSREGVRIGGSGNVTIDKSWIEATGQSGDHADSIQAYAPGSKGTVTITNSSIVAHNNNATAGLFVADNYTGTFVLENVIVWGGPYGLRIHPDTGGDNYISLKDVYFVGPFLWGRFLFQNVGGHINRFTKWENVRNATIVNGALVPGDAIACPDPANCPVSGGSLPAPTNLRIN